MIDTALQSSREIIEKAIADYQPYAKVLMFSGGSDSLAALQVCRMLDIKLDYIMHIHTNTGIKQTVDFVRDYCDSSPYQYLEVSAGDAYTDYVLRKGFFGVGVSAHKFSYHVLKAEWYRKGISKHIRQRKRNRRVLLINGARIEESANRKRNFTSPYNHDRAQPNNIWVNIIHYWSKVLRDEVISGCGKNPVSKALCRSGECMCGTMQTEGDRFEAAYHFPEWGQWLTDLEKEVKQRGFAWGWGENISKSVVMESAGQLNIFADEQDDLMCGSCKTHYEKASCQHSENLSTNESTEFATFPKTL